MVVAAAAGCRARPATPLAIAAASGDLATVERLLAAGADPDEPDARGWRPLHWAARHDQAEAVGALLRSGARVDSRDGGPNGWPPLMHAIHKGSNRAARALLDHAGGVDAAAGGATALVMAAGYGNTEMVVELLSRGAEPTAEALWSAAGGGSLADITDGPPFGTCFPEVVDALLAAAPELKLPEGLASHALLWAARSPECSELIRKLRPESTAVSSLSR